MIPIYKSWLIQIEITNACTFKCANCTRFFGHQKKPYFMTIEEIEKAIDSLEGYKGGIGIMGGEPTLHPRFKEICELLRSKVSPYKCGLWTSGYKWEEYKKIIKKTFKFVCSYNDHSSPTQVHQPVLVAIEDVVNDKSLIGKLINKCWVQEKWSPSINPKGGFFCEVAAAMDVTFNGPGGYPIEKGWWIKDPEDFRDQIERYCKHCGAALPFPEKSNKLGFDMISPSNLERLKKLDSPKIKAGKYKVFDQKMDKEVSDIIENGWDPAYYLGFEGKKSRFFLINLIKSYLNEFSRKKKFKLDELWLLNRGTFSTYRIFHNIKRRFFEKPPVKPHAKQ